MSGAIVATTLEVHAADRAKTRSIADDLGMHRAGPARGRHGSLLHRSLVRHARTTMRPMVHDNPYGVLPTIPSYGISPCSGKYPIWVSERPAMKNGLLNRLSRIEGQVRGITRMV